MSAALPTQFDKQSRSGVRAIVEFFVLTYVASWAFFTAAGYVLGRIPSDTLISSFLFLGGTIVPSLVAIALTARNAGRNGVGTLLRAATKWRVGLRWYVLALSYMAVIKLAAALLNRLTLGTWPRFGQVPWYLIIVAIMFSTPVQAGEEIGWRGYALPRLTKHFGLAGASIALGVIWACWHLPFFFIPGSDNFGQSFLLYLMAVTAISVAMAWVYWRTNGSLLLTMLLHASINNTAGIVPSPASTATTSPFYLNASLVAWLVVVLLWTGAAYFLIQMRGASLNNHSSQSAFGGLACCETN